MFCVAALVWQLGVSPSPPPSLPPPFFPGTACNNACYLAGNGVCEDGGPGSSIGSCRYGEDCVDCGFRVASPSPYLPPPNRGPSAPPSAPPSPGLSQTLTLTILVVSAVAGVMLLILLLSCTLSPQRAAALGSTFSTLASIVQGTYGKNDTLDTLSKEIEKLSQAKREEKPTLPAPTQFYLSQGVLSPYQQQQLSVSYPQLPSYLSGQLAQGMLTPYQQQQFATAMQANTGLNGGYQFPVRGNMKRICEPGDPYCQEW